jgi:hypothetical protein
MVRRKERCHLASEQETHDRLLEKARRALSDNPEPGQKEVATVATESYMDQIDLRIRAIQILRENGPKRVCFSERVRSLTQSLLQIPGDSVHYKNILERLQKSHEEWLLLEEKLWAANYTIRSTEWLVELLADPGEESEVFREVASTHEG